MLNQILVSPPHCSFEQLHWIQCPGSFAGQFACLWPLNWVGCLPAGDCQRQGELVKWELSDLLNKWYLLCESCSDVNASYKMFTKVIFQFSHLALFLAVQICTHHTFPPVWSFLPFVFFCLSKLIVCYLCCVFGFPV